MSKKLMLVSHDIISLISNKMTGIYYFPVVFLYLRDSILACFFLYFQKFFFSPIYEIVQIRNTAIEGKVIEK